MNPTENTSPTPKELIALRADPDAIRVITDRLRVREMGPADHIRTKHEVKAFVASGDATEAQELLNRANARRALNQAATQRITHHQRQGHTP